MWWTVAAAVAFAQTVPSPEADLIEQGKILTDDRAPLSMRLQAAELLAASGDERALGLLRAGAGARNAEVQVASVRAALAFDGGEATGVARKVLFDPLTGQDVHKQVVVLLGDRGSATAARVLFDTANAKEEVAARIRVMAARELREHYPRQTQSFGEVRSSLDPVGGTMMIAAGAVLGGTLLGSIGEWGQSEAAVPLGVVGGGLIGGGGGAVYAASTPVSAAQGMGFASGVAWGLTGGQLVGVAAHGSPNARDGTKGDLIAAYNTVGVIGGGAVGAFLLTRDPTVADVLEVDLSGVLGSGLGRSIAVLIPRKLGRTGSKGSAMGSLIGGAAGLSLGAALRAPWELDRPDVAVATVAAAEGARIGLLAPLAVDPLRGTAGPAGLPAYAGFAAGLVLNELHPVPVEHAVISAVSGAAGNLVGLGAASLVGGNSQARAATMLPVGFAGAVGGYLAAPLLDPDSGDWAMVTVGSGIGFLESTLLAGLISSSEGFQDVRGFGLVPLGTGLSALGLMAVTPLVEPRADAMVVIGTGTLWGVGVGALLLPALGLIGDDVVSFALPAAGGAVVSAGVGVAMLPSVGLQPRQTALPQVLALGGAATGAMVAALSTQDEQGVALGALAGTAAGFAGGAALVAARAPRANGVQHSAVQLPGTWMPKLGTFVGSGGALIPTLGIQGLGW